MSSSHILCIGIIDNSNSRAVIMIILSTPKNTNICKNINVGKQIKKKYEKNEKTQVDMLLIEISHIPFERI